MLELMIVRALVLVDGEEPDPVLVPPTALPPPGLLVDVSTGGMFVVVDNAEASVDEAGIETAGGDETGRGETGTGEAATDSPGLDAAGGDVAGVELPAGGFEAAAGGIELP